MLRLIFVMMLVLQPVSIVCQCTAGWYRPAQGGPCRPCGAGTYMKTGSLPTYGYMCSSKTNIYGGVDPQCPSATTTWIQSYPAGAGNDGSPGSLVELGNGNTWTVDLEMVRPITYLRFWNDKANSERARGSEVRVGNSTVPRENPLCATLGGTTYNGIYVDVNQIQYLDCFATGRYLSVIKDGDWMRFGEMDIYGQCQQCPPNSMSPDQASSIDACQCMQGYGRQNFGNIWLCRTCSLGKYKP